MTTKNRLRAMYCCLLWSAACGIAAIVFLEKHINLPRISAFLIFCSFAGTAFCYMNGSDHIDDLEKNVEAWRDSTFRYEDEARRLRSELGGADTAIRYLENAVEGLEADNNRLRIELERTAKP